QIVADRNAHRALLLAVFPYRDPGYQAGFLESSVSVVVVQKIGTTVVGHVQVWPAVAVCIRPNDAQAVPSLRVGDACLFGEVGEGPIAIVMEERITGAGKAPRSALHGDTVVITEPSLAELR